MSYRATDIEDVGDGQAGPEQMLAQQTSPTPTPQTRRSNRKRKHEDLVIKFYYSSISILIKVT